MRDGGEPLTRLSGPFGPAERVLALPVAALAAMYRRSFGFDVRPAFAGVDALHLYRCDVTGMLFWRPERIAGDELFYRALSGVARSYYQEWRWEYDLVLGRLTAGLRLLEIGCGRGQFLRGTEGRAGYAKGLEFNRKAIADKVTRWDVEARPIELVAAAEPASYDLVCSFQVLEHVVDPCSFLHAAIAALKPGGLLAISVPNHAHRPFRRRKDPLDLPPHHMNHFTTETLARIARFFDLELVSVHAQPRRYNYDPVRGEGARAIARNLRRNVAKWLANRLYSVTGEPGPTLLGIFARKP